MTRKLIRHKRTQASLRAALAAADRLRGGTTAMFGPPPMRRHDLDTEISRPVTQNPKLLTPPEAHPAPEVLRQPTRKAKGGRPRGGVREAARELGVSEATARRALGRLGVDAATLTQARLQATLAELLGERLNEAQLRAKLDETEGKLRAAEAEIARLQRLATG
jgi:transposase-like protein